MPKLKKQLTSNLSPDQECDPMSVSSSDGTDTGSAKQSRKTRSSTKQESNSSKADNQLESKKQKDVVLVENSKNLWDGDAPVAPRNRMTTRAKHDIPSELLQQADKKSPKKNSKRTNPFGMSEHELLLALDESGGRLRKRKFNQSYQVDMKQCPVAGCDSRGHLMGKFERHFTLAACPIYHNLTPERCRENHEAYQRIKREQMEEAEEAEKQQAHHNTRKQADAGPTPAQIKLVDLFIDSERIYGNPY